MITLEQTKQYLRISHNIDDQYITDLIEMSKKFIEHQSGIKYIEGDTIYEMCILQCVSHFYDQRSPIVEKTVAQVPFTLDCLIKDIGMRGELYNA